MRMNDNEGNKEDDYNLYTEDIVVKPSVKYHGVIRLLQLAGGGILFGAFACVTFILLYSALWDRLHPDDGVKHTDIVITRDEYPTDEYQAGILPTQSAEGSVQDPTFMEGDPAAETKVEPASQNVIDNITRSIVKVGKSFSDSNYFQQYTSASGVIFAYVDQKYLLLTSYSEVSGQGDISVEFSDGTVVKGDYVSGDGELGIAVVAVSQSEFEDGALPRIYVCELGNSYQVHQGDEVVVAGRVMGADYAFNSGILTRVGVNESHTDAYVGLLYTSMGRLSDDHGFLFDSGGALVGIPVNDSVRESQVFYGISDVKRVIEALVNGVPMAYFGVMGETVTGTLANRYSLPLGVYVTSVEENSPAFAAGIQAGDVITAVDDESILTFNEFSEKIYKLGSGQKTTINVKRRARDGYYDIAFTVTLANKD